MLRKKYRYAGQNYIAIALATNHSDGQSLMVIYHPDDDGNNINVMNYNEFMEKFREVDFDKS